MAYPEIKYKGQYTLKRVLTLPAASTLTAGDVDKLVTLDATGTVILAPADTGFFGVLRTLNSTDQVATVDFTGVHNFTASGSISAGVRVKANGALTVAAQTNVAATTAVALTAAADGEEISVFFLN